MFYSKTQLYPMVLSRQLANAGIQKDLQDPMAQNRQLTNVTIQRDHLLHEEWTDMDETACREQAPLHCCCLTLYRILQLKVRKSENVGTHELIETITLQRPPCLTRKLQKMPFTLQALVSESNHSKQKWCNMQATWHPKEGYCVEQTGTEAQWKLQR